MSFADTVAFQSFWSQSWAAPLRASCVWLKRDPAPVVPALPNSLAPGWLRPLWLQRRVARAIQQRFRAMRAQVCPLNTMPRLQSDPTWTRDDWTPYHRLTLRVRPDAWLLTLFHHDLEGLLRVIESPPALLGTDLWTHLALGFCERLAQLYRELQRRHGARAARHSISTLLASYTAWTPAQPCAIPESGLQALGVSADHGREQQACGSVSRETLPLASSASIQSSAAHW